jgi:hypothetical protein
VVVSQAAKASKTNNPIQPMRFMPAKIGKNKLFSYEFFLVRVKHVNGGNEGGEAFCFLTMTITAFTLCRRFLAFY